MTENIYWCDEHHTYQKTDVCKQCGLKMKKIGTVTRLQKDESDD